MFAVSRFKVGLNMLRERVKFAATFTNCRNINANYI